MSSVVTVEKRKVADYKGDERPTWCPGCGDFGVLNSVFKALSEHNFDPKNIIIVSGIGCSSRLPFFTNAYGFHTVHGRAMPVAAGIRAVQPDMPVLAMGGDGDAFAIGVGHLVHAIRRNLNICYVVMDNAVYGLTKGQTSPTAERGLATKATPQGASDPAINPMLLALATGCTFVARGFSSKPKELADLISSAASRTRGSLLLIRIARALPSIRSIRSSIIGTPLKTCPPTLTPPTSAPLCNMLPAKTHSIWGSITKPSSLRSRTISSETGRK